jgi:prophage regulatory protein
MNSPHQKIDPASLYRWNDLKPYLPIGESSWRRMVNAKSAPQPIKLSRKCTLWRCADVLEWLEHPDTYQAPIRGMDGGIQ